MYLKGRGGDAASIRPYLEFQRSRGIRATSQEAHPKAFSFFLRSFLQRKLNAKERINWAQVALEFRFALDENFVGYLHSNSA